MPIARTVLGDIDPKKLGITMPHEHVLVTWPSARHDLGAAYDRNDIVEKASVEFNDAKKKGGLSAFVDCGPPELGRDVDAMVGVSKKTGVHIIAATGFYRHDMGFPLYWQIAESARIEEHFVKEISEGVGANKVKCGIIKIATTRGTITPSEENALRAAARVHKKLGVGITTHTDPEGWQETNIGLKQAEILLSEGADPSRCVIGHACGTPNISYLLSIVEKGFTVGIDRIGLIRPPLLPTDEIRVALVAALVASGHADKIVLSLDHQTVWVPRFPREIASAKTLSYLFTDFVPKLRKAGLSQATIDQIMVDNPRRILSFPG